MCNLIGMRNVKSDSIIISSKVALEFGRNTFEQILEQEVIILVYL